MRMFLSVALLTMLAAPAGAQVTPNNPPGSDSMSRATHPETQSTSAPEAAKRSDSSTDQGARESAISNRNQDAPNKTNQRPEQPK